MLHRSKASTSKPKRTQYSVGTFDDGLRCPQFGNSGLPNSDNRASDHRICFNLQTTIILQPRASPKPRCSQHLTQRATTTLRSALRRTLSNTFDRVLQPFARDPCRYLFSDDVYNPSFVLNCLSVRYQPYLIKGGIYPKRHKPKASGKMSAGAYHTCLQ